MPDKDIKVLFLLYGIDPRDPKSVAQGIKALRHDRHEMAAANHTARYYGRLVPYSSQELDTFRGAITVLEARKRPSDVFQKGGT